MKNLKIVLTAMLLVAGVIAFSSFKSQSYIKKAFDKICFYYEPQNSNGITDPNNWTNAETTDPSAIPGGGLCDATNFICAICFDNSFLVNDLPSSTILSNLNSTLISAFPTTHLPATTPALNIKVSSSPDVFVDVYQKSVQ